MKHKVNNEKLRFLYCANPLVISIIMFTKISESERQNALKFLMKKVFEKRFSDYFHKSFYCARII